MLFSAQGSQILTFLSVQDSLSVLKGLGRCLSQLRVALFLMIFNLHASCLSISKLASSLEEGMESRTVAYMLISCSLPGFV